MSPPLALLLIVAAISAFYLVRLRWFPWRDCPACGGARRIQGGGGVHRDCGKCKATGRVRRFGARGGK